MRILLLAIAVALITLPATGEEKVTVRDYSVKYVSSEDPNLTLYAAFLKTGAGRKPILVYLHGWYGNRYYVARDLENQPYMLERFFLIGVDMRGRGSTGAKDWWGTPDPELVGKPDKANLYSGGKPDGNGWGLNDIVDAIDTAKRLYPNDTLPDPVYVIGHSGGGGNTMGIVGKFPDYFTAAWAGSGMADWGEWARLTSWRASIEEALEAKLDENPEAFRAMGGLTTVENRLTPIALSHGDPDESVPTVLSRVYVEANAKLGKPVPYKVLKGIGHGYWPGPPGSNSPMTYEDIVGFIGQYTKPPVIPTKGEFVVAGFLKTRRFQVIPPSINSISNCTYSLEHGLSLQLTGGLSGTVKVRVPKSARLANAECYFGATPVTVIKSTWHDWDEFSFDYKGRADLKLSRY